MTTENKQIGFAIELPTSNALEVFTESNGLDPWLKQIESEARSLVPDISTAKGRASIASTAYKVSQSKTALDNIGKELVAELKRKPKLVDAERKRVRDYLDALRDDVRKPLSEWEETEEKRVSDLKEKVELIANAKDIPDHWQSKNIEAFIADIEAIVVDESYAELEAEAHREKARSLEALKLSFDRRKTYEAEQAELEKLRAEAAERERKDNEARIAREAVERAEREAAAREAKAKAESEAKAKAEKEAAEHRELELKLAAEKAEREKTEANERARQAELKAKADAERAVRETEERMKREAEAKAKAEAEEIAWREADKKHRARINRSAKSALMAIGLDDSQAKSVITAIAQRNIPNVSINY